VPIHKKPPNLSWIKACPRNGEERMEWEGRKEGALAANYSFQVISSDAANTR